MSRIEDAAPGRARAVPPCAASRPEGAGAAGWAVAHAGTSRRALLAAAAGLGLLPWPAAAQAPAPPGPVTILVPYGAGTGPDTLARLIANALQAAFGQPVVVENRPGASGNIASSAVARAAPDGRTLLMQANPFVINPALLRSVPYDPRADFTPIAKMTVGVLVLAVRPDLPVDSAQAFAALARARPGEVDYASPGIGTPQHMAMALFEHVAGVRLNHVPYRTSPPAIQDLIGRRVAAMALPIHTAVPLAQAGQIRILAVDGDRRAEVAPEIPTMAEAGFPGLRVDLWYGLLGPAGMPEPLVARINGLVNAWLEDPRTREQLRAQGMAPTPTTPAAFRALIESDLVRWAEVVRAAGITAE